MPLVATRKNTTIARPLKVLVPLIREELDAGEQAGLEHYRRAGEMLLEAKEQIAYGNWKAWIAKHFKATDGSALSYITASRYMRLAQIEKSKPGSITSDTSDYMAAIGNRRRRVEVHASWKKATAAARDLDAELFAQERQTEQDEIALHRELAEELVDVGYKALATRLHPDHGGSKDAMVRLRRVRDELMTVAKGRRFV